jgi:hypothetical protein
LVTGLLASANTIKEYYIKSKLEPSVELTESIKNMNQVKSYRYHLLSTFLVDDRKEVISEVQGEKNSGNTHIKGEMVNTPVDIYYIDHTIYNYDSFSQKWLVIESETSNCEELLISELNPLSNFKFNQVNNVSKVNFEKVDGVECLVVNCKPAIETQLLETMWKDFECQFWLDYKKRLIRKAELNAVNKKEAKTRLYVKATFSDFNQAISIKPPEK